MYLNEVIQGHYREYSEDRLSQIFKATFNQSIIFRKRFLQFLKIKHSNPALLKAVTQQGVVSHSKQGRLDILILDGNNNPFIVIENKIDAPLYASQLHTYNKVSDLSNIRKVALVKHYFQLNVPDAWEIEHWSDFHKYLENHPISEQSIDAFLIKNFMQHLKEIQMARVSRIESWRLRDLAKAMKHIRRERKPQYSLMKSNVFATASEFLDIVEQIVDRIRQEPTLVKKLNKNVRFTPWLGYWSPDDSDDDIWLGFETQLAKKPNGLKQLGTGLFFDTKRGTYYLNSYLGGMNWYDKYHEFKNFLDSDVYIKEAIDFWKKHLK